MTKRDTFYDGDDTPFEHEDAPPRDPLQVIAEANAKIAANTRRIRFYAWLITILTGLNFAIALARIIWGF